MSTAAKPRVALIGTGGTISSIGRDSLDLWEYMDTGLKAEPDELLIRFPEAAATAEIIPVRFRAMSSAAVGVADWLALDAAVHEAVARDKPLDGVVITHGTATLEETAYFLNLTLKVDVTVVIVGSQRPATGRWRWEHRNQWWSACVVGWWGKNRSPALADSTTPLPNHSATPSLYHCASSNGLLGGLTLGLGSIFSIAPTSPASPPPPTRTFNGEPFTSVISDACGSRFALVSSRNFSLLNACGVSRCMKRWGG